jgi:hypothetical protein
MRVDCPRDSPVVHKATRAVIFGRRAVLVQAKSKRLTIEARKGNDLQPDWTVGTECWSTLIR